MCAFNWIQTSSLHRHIELRIQQMRFWRQDNPLTVHTEDVIVREYKPCVEVNSSGTEEIKSLVLNGLRVTVHGQTSRLWPYAVIHAVVVVMNGVELGPPSELVEFRTPEGRKIMSQNHNHYVKKHLIA